MMDWYIEEEPLDIELSEKEKKLKLKPRKIMRAVFAPKNVRTPHVIKMMRSVNGVGRPPKNKPWLNELKRAA